MSDVLLEATLRATLIAAAAAVALWLLRARSAAVRHRVWTVVMLAMLALPFWITWAPEVALHVLPPPHAGSSSPFATPSRLDSSSRETLTEIVAEPAAAGGAVEPGASVVKAWNWRAWLLAIYLVGAVPLLVRLATGIARVSSLMREARIVNGRLTSARIATPFTVGWFEPKILLPEGWGCWPAALLASVLDHEHVHVGRRDPLVQCLALLNRALFWFHPLAWWLERHLAALAEEACDAAVLARGHGATDYAEHLLDLARMSSRRATPYAVGMPMPGSALPTRIAKILEDRVGRPSSRTAVAGAAALATLVATAIGTITLAQEVVPLAQQEVVPLAQQEVVPLAQEVVPGQEARSPRSLLAVYELALRNDPIVRETEAKYLALTEAPPQAQSSRPSPTVTQALTDYEAARQNLLARVAEAYFRVLAAEDRLAAEKAERAATSSQLKQAERRFEVGLIPTTQVQEAHAGFDQAAASAVAAGRTLAATRDALRKIVGEDVGELSRVIENLPLSALYLADANQAEQETRDAYRGVIAAISRVKALRDAVRSNQAALEAARRGFEVGTRNTVEVATEQNNLRRTETAYALSRYDYVLSVLRLRRAVGGSAIESLEEVESLLE